MTSSVSIVRSIPLNCTAVVPLLRRQLETLEEASQHGTVVLSARIPGDGRVAVPVRVRVTYLAPKTGRFGLAITSLSKVALYPRFQGGLDLAASGTAATTATLSGDYDVPFGMFGRALDATAARGIAPSGLADLLDRLVADLLAGVGDASDAAYRAGRGA
jgi:hypothetical protein